MLLQIGPRMFNLNVLTKIETRWASCRISGQYLNQAYNVESTGYLLYGSTNQTILLKMQKFPHQGLKEMEKNSQNF